MNTVRSPNFYVQSTVYERINNKSMWFRNLHALLKLNNNCNYLEIRLNTYFFLSVLSLTVFKLSLDGDNTNLTSIYSTLLMLRVSTGNVLLNCLCLQWAASSASPLYATALTSTFLLLEWLPFPFPYLLPHVFIALPVSIR